jgi:methyl-accepting chemotaxis protein
LQSNLSVREQNDGRSPNADPIVRRLDDATVALQYYYIQANTNPLGSKHKLDRADDNSRYSQFHEQFHPIIRSYLEKFGYYDIFLVHPQTGKIVYSVFKELDYGTSLLNGPYAQTNFGEAFRRANAANSADTFVITDLEQYFPSYEAPAGFVASPIFKGREKVGVLIFQFPLDSLNAIMTERSGMGKTGETYLVGNDMLMRSDSFLDPDNHSVVASFRHPDKGKVDTKACRSALKGNTEEKIITDYNGNLVLSAYTPLEFDGLHWALLAEIDEAEAFAAVKALQWVTMIVGLVGIAGIVTLALLITRAIVRPVQGVVDSLTDLAQGEGDLTTRLTVSSHDEIGRLAKRFNEFMDKLQAMITDITKGVETLSSSSTELSAISQQMSANAEQTSGKSNTVASAAEEMSANMGSVSAAMEQTSTNTGMVSSAAEEMTATINEIAKNAENARSISDQAVTQTRDAGEQMSSLGHAAQAIGKVTETITEISEQTNLLALNATIEAARAGEAGKGFAVVANEIKELAKQTATATLDIKQQIDGIQISTGSTVKGIEQIGQVIDNVNEIVSTIATAVEEQSVSTREIADNISQVSSGIGEVNENVAQSSHVAADITKEITEVNQASDEIASSSSQVRMSAEELSELAEQLNEMVGRFKI